MAELRISIPSDPGLKEAVGAVDNVKVLDWDLDAPPPETHIDLVVPPYWGGTRRLARIAEVSTRLVQWQSIGYNGVAKHLPMNVPFANAATVHEASTAELALALALAAQRGIPAFVRNGDQQIWQLRSYPSLADRRVLIIGYGGVGKAIEARLTGFEVQITRVARTQRVQHNLAGDHVEVFGFDQLHQALQDAEVVFLAVPLTEHTRALIDAVALAAMPDQALLVNVARGPVVDTGALISELQTGRLRAALDVTDPEPLPRDHALWHCPNLLVSPHVGGDSSAMLPRMSALIHRQIEHLKRGETPENLVLGS